MDDFAGFSLSTIGTFAPNARERKFVISRAAKSAAGSLEDGLLRFSVRDNGCGFDPATCPGVMQGHFGLQCIRERVNQFNGEMEIESSPGKGARVSVCLTLNGS